ncbi:MAG: DUF4214 domain-containing protein [Roseobacter sp.]
MTTYILPSVEITYSEEFQITAVSPSEVRIVVPDSVNAFQYEIVQSFPNAIPDVAVQVDVYGLFTDTGPIPFTERGYFELGFLNGVQGELSTSYAVMTIVPDGAASFPYPNDQFLKLAGDPIPDGSLLAEFQDWAASLTAAGDISEGALAPGELILFEAIEGVTKTENDLILGSIGDDTYFTGIGNDTVIAGSGNDSVDGGDGFDMIVVANAQSGYTLTLSSAGTILTDRSAQGSGEDRLISIETVSFDGSDPAVDSVPFNIDAIDGGTALTSAALIEIVELYIAYFNRAPDAIGLNFWATQVAEGLSLDDMAGFFFDQVETRALYASVLDENANLTDVSAFVTAVYNNVLGRIPDQLGFEFWVSTLQNAPDITPANFILAVLEGAKSPDNPTPEHAIDRAYLTNKAEIGAQFSVTLGMSNVENATQVMGLFEGTESSFAQALDAAAGFHTQALDPSSGEFLLPLVGVLDSGEMM